MRSMLVLLVLLVLGLVLPSTRSHAERVPAFTEQEEVSCQRTVGHLLGRLVGDLEKKWVACFEAAREGEGPCTGFSAAEEEARFRDGMVVACAGSDFPKLGLGTDVTAAAETLIDATQLKLFQLNQVVFGANTSVTSDPGLLRCLETITKVVPKLLTKQHLVNGRRCLDADDRQQLKNPAKLPLCNEAKRKIRTANLIAKATKKMARDCSAVQVSQVTTTSFFGAEPLAKFSVALGNEMLCRAYPAAGNLRVCPDQIQTLVYEELHTEQKLGWSGLVHGAEQGPTLGIAFDLDNCHGFSPRTCDLVAPTAGTITNVRPNITLGTATCVVTEAMADATGGIRFTGALDEIDWVDLNFPRRVHTYLGASREAPCPVCTGIDLGALGVCVGGLNEGQGCIVDQISPGLPHASSTCIPDPDENGLFDTISFEGGGMAFSSDPIPLAAELECLNPAPGTIGLGCHCAQQSQPNACEGFLCDPETLTCANGRSCFSQAISLAGSTDPDGLTLAAIGCIDANNNLGTAAALGLPGPVTSEKRVRLTPSQFGSSGGI